MYTALCQKIECVAADGAADEQLAARELGGITLGLAGPDVTPLSSLQRDLVDTLPNLKLCCRDRAHAAQRVMLKPAMADPDLRKIQSELVTKTNSISKMITYFPTIQEIWLSNRDSMVDPPISTAVRNMAYAPQRYSSETQTLLRLVLTFPATLTTMAQVSSLRGKSAEAGQAMLQSLEFLTDPKMCVLLGMLADGLLELHKIVLLCDQADLDEADLCLQMEHYHAALNRLFIEKGCFAVPGCTSLMLSHLREEFAFVVNGRPASIGGAHQAMGQELFRIINMFADSTLKVENKEAGSMKT